MSDDLVKRLRDLGDHASFEPHMHHTAADRIEELEAKLKWVLEERDITFALMLKRMETAEAKLRDLSLEVIVALGQAQDAHQAQLEAESKLAKAVSTLEYIADTLALYSAKECLAELKGDKDE